MLTLISFNNLTIFLPFVKQIQPQIITIKKLEDRHQRQEV